MHEVDACVSTITDNLRRSEDHINESGIPFGKIKSGLWSRNFSLKLFFLFII